MDITPYSKDDFPQIEKLDQVLREKAEKGKRIFGFFLSGNEDYHMGQWAEALCKFIEQSDETSYSHNLSTVECSPKLVVKKLDTNPLFRQKTQHTR